MTSQITQSDIGKQISKIAGPRLAEQLRFILEIDKLKLILRQTPLIDQSRRENDAEHSWHLAIMGMILAEHADSEVDMGRVMRMHLIHDIVEIDAGDTFLYDSVGVAAQEEKEQRAADRLFGLLPAEQGAELRALWDEFEAHKTADAQFARAMDRLQPFLHNILTKGEMWQQHKVTADDVRARLGVIADGSKKLSQLMLDLVDFAQAEGFLYTPPK